MFLSVVLLFFDNSRALIGIQIPVSSKLKFGSEALFALSNYMELKSGDLKKHSFNPPMIKWNFTIRYEML